MERILQKFLRVHTILLCGLFFPLAISAQQERDSNRQHLLDEVAVMQPKMDALMLLRKLVLEKQHQFRDTQIAYILIRENVPQSQADAMPDGLLISFRNGEVKEVSTFPYTNSRREGYSKWKFSVMSAFGEYILFEKSLENFFLSRREGGVTASSQESTKVFHVRSTGNGKWKDSLLYVYQFKDTGTAEMISYYDALRIRSSPKRVLQYVSASIFPTKAIYTQKEEPDVQYIFQSVPINPEEKTLFPFARFKHIEVLLKR